MTTAAASRPTQLSSSLFAVMAEPKNVLFAGTVTAVRQTAADQYQEAGILNVHVGQVLAGADLKAGMDVEVPFQRDRTELAQAKGGANGWNRIPLQPGTVLLLGCKPFTASQGLVALAGQKLSGPDDPTLAGAKRALDLQHLARTDPRKREALQAALADDNVFLYRYALYALEEPNFLPASDCVHVLSINLRRAGNPPSRRDDYVATLSRISGELQTENAGKPGSPAQHQQYVSLQADAFNSLALALAAEPQPEQQSRLLDALYPMLSSAVSADASAAGKLEWQHIVQAVPVASRQKLLLALQQLKDAPALRSDQEQLGRIRQVADFLQQVR